MDLRDEMEPDQLEMLSQAFRGQLLACLEECARGRRGLFSASDDRGSEAGGKAWPEAERLRKLALALQAVFNQQERHDRLCEEFLDLCTIHGESDPGEPKLARAFLDRIEKGEVGTRLAEEKKPW